MRAILKVGEIRTFLMERAKLIDEMRAHKRRANQMNHFRPLNENEFHCLQKIKTDIDLITCDDISISYVRMAGGFTVATVKYEIESKVVLYVGASRRSYKDKPNTTRGEILAFRRAIQTKPILLSSSPDVEGAPL